MRKGGRKLLVASLGVGAISYVACGGSAVANLMAPPRQDAGMEHEKGDAQDGPSDTADTGPSDVGSPLEFVANLVAPLP
jgi:hypothetical protein